MDIDTAIKHSKEIYRNCKNVGCAIEHGQLANWLQQLKELKAILGEDYDLDRIKELIQADKAGRILIIQDVELSDEATFNFVNSLLEDLKSGKTEQTK